METEKEMETQNKLCEIVKNYLDGKNATNFVFKYNQLDDCRFSSLVSGLEGCTFNELHLLITVQDTCVYSECFLPVSASPEVFADVSEYFTRINHVIGHGFLILDYDNGIMKYDLRVDSTELLYDDEHLELSMRYLLELGPRIFDQIGASLAAILFGGKNGRSIKEIFEEDLAVHEDAENEDSEKVEE